MPRNDKAIQMVLLREELSAAKERIAVLEEENARLKQAVADEIEYREDVLQSMYEHRRKHSELAEENASLIRSAAEFGLHPVAGEFERVVAILPADKK